MQKEHNTPQYLIPFSYETFGPAIQRRVERHQAPLLLHLHAHLGLALGLAFVFYITYTYTYTN